MKSICGNNNNSSSKKNEQIYESLTGIVIVLSRSFPTVLSFFCEKRVIGDDIVKSTNGNVHFVIFGNRV